MRITKSLLYSLLFVFVLGTASASGDPTKDATENARLEMKDLIKKSNLATELTDDISFHVTFIVNKKNQIIILSTSNENYDHAIKRALNYKKLESTEFAVNTTYTLPVALKR